MCRLPQDYYIGRLSNNIAKIITIPAALQGIDNPVPRVVHPDWLKKRVRELKSGKKQQKINSFFAARPENRSEQSAMDLASGGDIEDMFGLPKSSGSGAPPRPVLRKFFRKRPPMVIAAEEAAVEKEKAEKEAKQVEKDNKPDVEADYGGWVASSKKSWTALRADRKKRRAARADEIERYGYAAPAAAGRAGDTGGLAQFGFQRNSSLASNQRWDLIQVVEDAPGVYLAWALVGGKTLQKMRLNVPRLVYINSIDERPDLEANRVRRILPHSRPALHIYCEAVPEEREPELQLMLGDPSVEGIYEVKQPQLMRVLAKLGCACQLSGQQRADSAGGYNLDQIEAAATDASSPYLAGGALQKVFLYHSQSGKDRAVFGLFDGATQQGKVVVVSRQAGTLERVNVKRLLKELGLDQQTEGGVRKCDLVYAATLEQGQRAMQKEIARLQKDRGSAPLVLVLQSSLPLSFLKNALPALSDMPCVAKDANPNDSEYQPLGWETPAVKTMLKRSAQIEEWWVPQLEVANYARVPVGNLELDVYNFITDVALSRSLAANNFCSWYSDTALPDLGGNEEDRGITAVETAARDVPGAYRTICVEIDLFGLAVNTVLNADLVDDIDGASILDDSMQTDDVLPGEQRFDDATSTIAAFKVLKSLVERWYSTAQNVSHCPISVGRAPRPAAHLRSNRAVGTGAPIEGWLRCEEPTHMCCGSGRLWLWPSDMRLVLCCGPDPVPGVV